MDRFLASSAVPACLLLCSLVACSLAACGNRSEPSTPSTTTPTDSIAPSSSIEGPRDAGGNQTVWLLDTAGEPIVKVQVTRGMKRVEIGRSCRTLDAR